jgi:DNA-binding response OmpR family regulator
MRPGSAGDDYITKPFSPRKLLERIRDLLDRNEVKKVVGL